MKKKHLVIDARMLQHSGIGTYLQNVIPYLKYDFKITLIGNKDLILKYDLDNIGEIVEFNEPIFSIAEQLNLPFIIPVCDIFWTPHFNVPFFIIRASKRFTTICDGYYFAHFDTFSFVQKIYTKLMVWRAITSSKFIFTLSKFSKSELIKFTDCKDEKLLIVSCGLAENYNSGYQFQRIEQKYILYVGNVKPHKNLRNALIAFKKIVKEFPAYKFYIVGKREGFITQDDNLADLILELNEAVFFTGYVDDGTLKNYYANASIFLFPSKYEGFGLPPLEAMAFNIPIVSSNAASIPEVGGDAILYFDPNSPDEMVSQIKKVIKQEWKPNLELYKKQIEKFNWKDVAQKHIDSFSI